MDKKGLKAAFLGSTAIAAAALIGALGFGDAEMSEDQKTVDAICATEKPLLIIDYFSAEKPDYGYQASDHKTDIDGDRIPDIHHGDMAKKIAELSGKTVIAYGLGKSSEEIIPDTAFIKALDEIIERIEKDEISPAAISLSIDRPSTIADLHQSFGADLGLTLENIATKKSAIIERIKKAYGENGSGDPHIDFFYETHQRFEKLKELGVSVITVAGNSASKKAGAVNMLNILGGSSVGALTEDRNEIADLSNQNTPTSVYRVGVFKTHRVDGGVDINNDGKADFSVPALSNNIELIRAFRGNSTWGATIKGTSFATPNICGKDAGPGNLAWLYKMIP